MITDTYLPILREQLDQLAADIANLPPTVQKEKINRFIDGHTAPPESTVGDGPFLFSHDWRSTYYRATQPAWGWVLGPALNEKEQHLLHVVINHMADLIHALSDSAIQLTADDLLSAIRRFVAFTERPE